VDANTVRWGSRRPLGGPLRHKPVTKDQRRQYLVDEGNEGMYIVNLLVYSIASPNPVEVPAQHGPRTITEGGQGDENKWVRNNGPEKDIARIPEDDWETDCRPEGNPGICLGILHHFFRCCWNGRVTVTSARRRRPWLTWATAAGASVCRYVRVDHPTSLRLPLRLTRFREQSVITLACPERPARHGDFIIIILDFPMGGECRDVEYKSLRQVPSGTFHPRNPPLALSPSQPNQRCVSSPSPPSSSPPSPLLPSPPQSVLPCSPHSRCMLILSVHRSRNQSWLKRRKSRT